MVIAPRRLSGETARLHLGPDEIAAVTNHVTARFGSTDRGSPRATWPSCEHALRGFKPTRYSVHVNGPWCITFEFDDGDACRVDFEQYH